MEFDEAAMQLGRFSEGMLAIAQNTKLRITDIRVKIGSPILLCGLDKVMFLVEHGCVSMSPKAEEKWIVTQQDIEALFHRFCGYAVYSHIDELKHGFVSVGRKFRVGVSGTAVIENGKFQTIRDITSMTIRIPRAVHGCANSLYRLGVNPKHGVLLAGAPSSGKTTMLRDLARILGSENRVVILDERFELRSEQYDVGVCTDVLQGYPKKEGISHALRCLSPEYILCDELEDRDIAAIQSALFAGVSLVATVHAGSKEELYRRALCRKLIETSAFEYIVVLKGRSLPTEIQGVYRAGEFLENHSNIPLSRKYYSNWIY